MPLRPEAWARAREVFEHALALPHAERDAYVAAACSSDHALRDEIERMLDSHGRAAGFLSTPAAELLAASAARSLEGQRIGPYQLSSRIGAGGMGEVYKARDTRLDRTVPHQGSSARGRQRPASAPTLHPRRTRDRCAQP